MKKINKPSPRSRRIESGTAPDYVRRIVELRSAAQNEAKHIPSSRRLAFRSLSDEIEIKCFGISDDGIFLKRHTGKGLDISPKFEIKGLSPKAVSIAITLDDVEHQVYDTFCHWVIWNLPPKAVIPEGIEKGKAVPSLGGAVQGLACGIHKYAGPNPPDDTSHKYVFSVYVLDSKLDLSPRSGKKHLLSAMEGHIIQKGQVSGRFE